MPLFYELYRDVGNDKRFSGWVHDFTIVEGWHRPATMG